MLHTRIVPPLNFCDVGDLSQGEASHDPRQETFTMSELEIDLRRCALINPPAVLWCTVYPLLACLRGTSCRLLAPENTGTAAYLKESGLYPILRRAGVEVDGIEPLSHPGSGIVLPVTRFDDEADVDSISNQVELRLAELGLGSANMRSLVADILVELAFNAAMHSHSSIGAYGLIQFHEWDGGNRFLCAIADGGIGVRRALQANASLSRRVPNDWASIDLASRERISGTGDPMRGIGLHWISEEVRKAGRQLVLHSGLGAMSINEDVESQAKRAALFPGTLAFVSIPT